jgi:hypothetical protein
LIPDCPPLDLVQNQEASNDILKLLSPEDHESFGYRAENIHCATEKEDDNFENVSGK